MNGREDFRCYGDEFLNRHRLFGFNRLIATADNQRVFLEIAGSNFDPDRDAFLDPLPIFNAATDIAPVHLHFQWNITKAFSP